MKHIICVTGPMAAGKNTVAAKFVRRGYLAIDADEVVHGVIDRLGERIAEEFDAEAHSANVEIVRNDGSIDRRALGALIFHSPPLLARQERLVLPEVESEILGIINANPNRDIVLNAVSLYKTPRLMQLCCLVVFVTANVVVRYIRVRRRDGLPPRQVINRFASQRHLLSCYENTGIPILRFRN